MRKPIWRRLTNRTLHLICRLAPGGDSLRPLLHTLRGVRVGQNVFIGEDVYIDGEYPECVEIQDGAQIALRSTIVAHTRGSGGVVIGRNSFIGAGCLIIAPAGKTLVVGEGAVVMAGSVVTTSVAPFTMCGSERARPLSKVTKPLPLCTEYMEFVRGLRPMGPATTKHEIQAERGKQLPNQG
jgi:acetyltransferase-like isoleucine patch superfamily enzyme